MPADGYGLRRWLRVLVFGRNDSRVRATWRVLLAWPLLPLVGTLVGLTMPVVGLRGMIPGGPMQGLFMLGILLIWARYIDCRPLTDYGVSFSTAWLSRQILAFAVVVAVWSVWHGIASWLGWMQVEWSMTAPQGDVGLRLAGALLSLAINTWVQDVVFFGIVLVAAAQGIRSREVEPRQAVIGGWLVAAVFFTAIHGTPTLLDFLGTLVSGLVFGLLYVHTGDLALTIGVHWGSSYAAGFIFPRVAMAQQGAAIFRVTELGPLAKGMEVPLVLYPATYLLLVVLLGTVHKGLPIDIAISEYSDREGSVAGVD